MLIFELKCFFQFLNLVEMVMSWSNVLAKNKHIAILANGSSTSPLHKVIQTLNHKCHFYLLMVSVHYPNKVQIQCTVFIITINVGIGKFHGIIQSPIGMNFNPLQVFGPRVFL